MIVKIGVIELNTSGLLEANIDNDESLDTQVPGAGYNFVEVSELNDEHWITKHNDLIESSSKLTLQQQRILLIIASRIQPKDENFKLYRFNTKDIIEILGLSTRSGSYYNQIKSIVNDLQTKTLTIKSQGRETNFTWVITSDYYADQGVFQVELHPKLKPYFLQLKDKFTQYRLENILRLNSPYAIRMYELLKQYEGIRVRRFDVDELKVLLAIEPGKYKQYGHFKSKILIHSQEQIEKHTDLRFEFKEIKTGRKITRLEFHIKSKAKQVLEIEVDEVNSKLSELGIGAHQIKKIRDKWDTDYVTRNVEYVLQKQKYSNITNPAGYLIQALTDDYGKEAPSRTYIREEPELELEKNENTDKRIDRYELNVEDYEKNLISIRKLQRKLEAPEDMIKTNIVDDIQAYCTYQNERHGVQVNPNQFSDESFSSYCSSVLNMV